MSYRILLTASQIALSDSKKVLVLSGALTPWKDQMSRLKGRCADAKQRKMVRKCRDHKRKKAALTVKTKCLP